MDTVALALVPPLWGVVVSYAAPVEQLMLAALPLFAPHCTAKIDDAKVMKAAAECGEPTILMYVHLQPLRFEWSWAVVRDVAIKHGRLEALQWQHDRGHLFPNQGWQSGANLMAVAAKYGHIHLITYMREIGLAWNDIVTNAAAEHSLEVLQAVRCSSDPCPWSEWQIYQHATKSDDPRTIQYLIDENCGNDIKRTALACAMHHIRSPAMLDMYIKHLGQLHGICSTLAANGRISMIAAARERGQPWSDDTCQAAATAGQWDTLMWLRDNGCPWSTFLRASTRQSTVPAVVAWMAAGGDAP